LGLLELKAMLAPGGWAAQQGDASLAAILLSTSKAALWVGRCSYRLGGGAPTHRWAPAFAALAAS